MANRLERVTLCYFRGGTCPVDIEFDRTKPVAVIFGENGNGKSSIVDAIGCALRGDVGSLRLISVPSARTKYLASLGTKPVNMQVSATVSANTWTARLNKTDVEIDGPRPLPPVHILRRAEVLKLITSEPKDRYSVLRDLIAVERIEEAGKQLRQAAKDAHGAVEAASERRAEAERILNDLWVQKGKPGSSAVAWARTETAADILQMQHDASAARRLLETVTKASEALDRFRRASVVAVEAEAAHRDARARLHSVETAEEVLLLDVLQAAERVLGSQPTTCPVCEQAISPGEVQFRITRRIAALKALKQLKAEVDEADKFETARAAVVEQERRTFTASVGALCEGLDAVRGRFSDLPVTPKGAVSDDDAAALVTKVIELRDKVESSINAADAKQHQQKLIGTNLGAVDEAVVSLDLLHAKAKRLDAMSAVVENVRKHYVNDVLTEISGRAAALYAKIHPAEPIGNVSLSLKQAAAGSLELSGVFGSETKVPPQAYYSESHLDTLGVCVFLAMAERDEDAIVVLDDVFTSVDDAHLARIIELLHEQASNVGHLIITTHYRAWRDRYKYARGPTANAELIELLPWTRGRGIRHTKMRVSADELTDALLTEPADRIGVAARAGVLLEALLDDLTLRYRCRMPRRPDANYTLGELLDAMDAKLLKSMRTIRGVDEAKIEPLVQAVGSLTFLRNKIGCHFDLGGSDVSDKDVRAFGEATLALAKCLTCQDCGEVPRHNRSGEHWQCSCGLTKLAPLVRPGERPA